MIQWSFIFSIYFVYYCARLHLCLLSDTLFKRFGGFHNLLIKRTNNSFDKFIDSLRLRLRKKPFRKLASIHSKAAKINVVFACVHSQ